MFFLFASSYVLGDTFTDGRRIEPMKNTGLIKRKGTIKTIEVIMSAKCIFFFSFFFNHNDMFNINIYIYIYIIYCDIIPRLIKV